MRTSLVIALILSICITIYSFAYDPSFPHEESICGLPELAPHQRVLIPLASDSCIPYFDMVMSNDILEPRNILEMIATDPLSLADPEFYETFFNLAFNPYELYSDYTIPSSFADESTRAWDALVGNLPITYRLDLRLDQSSFSVAATGLRIIINGQPFILILNPKGISLGIFDRPKWDIDCEMVLRHEIMEYIDGLSPFRRYIFYGRKPEIYWSQLAENEQSKTAPFAHFGLAPIIGELGMESSSGLFWRARTGELPAIRKALLKAAITMNEPFVGYINCKQLIFKIKSDPEMLLRFRSALADGYAALAEDSFNRATAEAKED